MIIIVKTRYFLNDVIRHQKSYEYVMIIIKAVKVIKFKNIYNQFDII